VGIGVRQPGHQGKRSDVYQNAENQHPGVEVRRGQHPDLDTSGMHHHAFDPNFQDDAAKNMYQAVPDPGISCGPSASAPDQDGRENCHDFPVQEQGNQVASKTHSHSASSVSLTCSQFKPTRSLQGVKRSAPQHHHQQGCNESTGITTLYRLDSFAQEIRRRYHTVGHLRNQPQHDQRNQYYKSPAQHEGH